ncbi:MAG: hypothetical protein SFU83_01775 [Meiothermus sp.]|nr:hypothetical protein [Meiothermus sp.]
MNCVKRRQVLKLLGATSAAALTACGSSIHTPSNADASVPARSVRVGFVSQVLTQFPLIGSFKRYRSNAQGSEDVFVMRTPFMPRTALGEDEGIKIGEHVLLLARTLVCTHCNHAITSQPIQPQCACSYAGAQSLACRQSGCQVFTQGLEIEMHCQNCGSIFNPETGTPIWGQASTRLFPYPIEKVGNELHILL